MAGEVSIGGIVGYLRLDRSEWAREMDAARNQARELGRENPKISIDTNAREAMAELERVAIAAKRLQDAQGKVSVAQAKVNELEKSGTATSTQLTRAREALAKATRDVEVSQIRLTRAFDDDSDSVDKLTRSTQNLNSRGMRPLMLLAITLGPTLLPFAAAAAAALGSAALGAAALGAAVYGASQEMKQGTAVGKQYSSGIATLKGYLNELSMSAATTTVGVFNDAVADAREQFPQLSTELRQFADIAGTDVRLAIHGLVGGLTGLEPLLVRLGNGSVKWFTQFDTWANGSGVKNFSTYIEQNLPAVASTLKSLGQAIVDLFQGLAPFAGVGLHFLESLSELISSMNPAVISALAIAYAAWAVSTSKLFSSFGKLPVFVPIWISLALALDQVTSSANHTQSALDRVMDAVSKAGNGNFSGALRSAVGDPQLFGSTAGSNLGKINGSSLSSAQKNQSITDFYAPSTTVSAAVEEVSKANAALGALGSSSGGLAQYNTQLEQAAQNTQALSDHTAALNSNSSDNRVNVGFDTRDVSAYNLALKDANGNQAEALKILQRAAHEGPVYQQQLVDIALQQQRITDATSAASDATGLSTQQVLLYGQALGISGREIATNVVSSQAFKTAIVGMNDALKVANGSVSSLVDAMTTYSTSAGNAKDKTALVGAILKTSQGDMLSYTGALTGGYDAQRQFLTGFDATQRAAIDAKTGLIDYTKAGAVPLVQALQAMQDQALTAAQAVYQHNLAIEGSDQAGKDAITTFNTLTRDTLIKNAQQLGLTKDAAKLLADQYFATSQTLDSDIKSVGLDTINGTLDHIGQLLANLTGQVWKIQLYVPDVNADAKLAFDSNRRMAKGGWVDGAGTGTSDSIPIWASKGEVILPADVAAKHAGLVNAMLAKGTTTGPIGSPAATAAHASYNTSGSAGQPTVVHHYTTVEIDGRAIGQSVDEYHLQQGWVNG